MVIRCSFEIMTTLLKIEGQVILIHNAHMGFKSDSETCHLIEKNRMGECHVSTSHCIQCFMLSQETTTLNS